MKNTTQPLRIVVSRFGVALLAICMISLVTVACGSSEDDGATLAAINEAKSAAERAAYAAEDAASAAETAASAAEQASSAAQDDTSAVAAEAAQAAAEKAADSAESAMEAAQQAGEAAEQAGEAAVMAAEKAQSAADTAATAVAPPSHVTITHYSGTDTVPVNPQTVVVFDLGVLLSLHDLGVEVDAVGGLGTPIPSEYEAIVNNPNYQPVGSVWEPDYEAINAMEPDLIIVASRSSRIYPEMSRIAPTVDLTVDWWVEDYLNDFREVHRSMGKIFGVEEEVEQRLDEIEAAIDGIRSQSTDAGKALIVMTTGAEVTAFGTGSRFGYVHDLFGFQTADDSLERDATHGDAVSFEYILEAAPEVMFVVDRAAAIGGEGEVAKQILDNELVAQTPAWQNDRMVYVDNFAWYIAAGALPSFFQIIDDLASAY